LTIEGSAFIITIILWTLLQLVLHFDCLVNPLFFDACLEEYFSFCAVFDLHFDLKDSVVFN
jgi:hypothetical protein